MIAVCPQTGHEGPLYSCKAPALIASAVAKLVGTFDAFCALLGLAGGTDFGLSGQLITGEVGTRSEVAVIMRVAKSSSLLNICLLFFPFFPAPSFLCFN